VRALPFDPGDPSFIDDPYPTFAGLRERGGVHWHDGLGFWIAVSYEACSAVLRSPLLQRVWRDADPVEQFEAFNLMHRHSMLETQPPRHTRLRRLVSGAFNRGHTDRLRTTVQAIADRLVDDLAQRIADDGAADLITTVAGPLPIEIIAELLGVPAEDRHRLQPWSNAIVKMYEYGLPQPRQAAAERAAAEFIGYLRTLVDNRRREPADDLISDLVAITDSDGDQLSADELVGTAALLLMAGHEATVNVLGNGMLALLRNPGQWTRLLHDPDVLDAAVEELIRYDSPLQLFERTAVADVQIAGVPVTARQKIAALLGAAARDPAIFPEPDMLDVGRHPNPHLGFGAGIHYCLGAPLARVEVRAALSALTRQLPGLRLAGEPVRRAEFVIRGLRTLPVTSGTVAGGTVAG
jgi:cytochrome P450